MLHEHDSRDDDRKPGNREDASPHIFSRDSLCPPGWRRRAAAFREHLEYSHGFRDVLDRLLAEVFVAESEFVAELFMDTARDEYGARFGETLQARGDVDAVTIDLFAIHHHVAEVDADAEFHPALGWDIRVFCLERGLNVDRALDR